MRHVLFVCLFTLAAGVASAQTPAPSTQSPPPSVAALTPIEADRATLLVKRQRIQTFSEVAALLQKEIDAAIADYSRDLQRLAAAAPAGTQLDPQTLAYVKKPEPAKAPETKKQ